MTTRAHVIAGAIALAAVMGFNGNALAQTPRTSAPVPVMNEELMERLIKFTRLGSAVGSINPKLCSVLELCDGTKDMPLKMAKSDVTTSDHYFARPLNADSKDILFLTISPDVDYAYLTDKTGKLRAAAISDRTSVRLITNEKAAKKYKAELALFAKEAADLPPTR